MVDLVPKRYSNPRMPYWLQPRTVEKAKRRMASAIKPLPALPNTVEKASETSAVLAESEIISPVLRSTTPLDRIANAVREHTTMVSAKTSKMPHMPCMTGSRILEAEWTMTEEPRPASLENTPRFIPQVTARRTP